MGRDRKDARDIGAVHHVSAAPIFAEGEAKGRGGAVDEAVNRFVEIAPPTDGKHDGQQLGAFLDASRNEQTFQEEPAHRWGRSPGPSVPRDRRRRRRRTQLQTRWPRPTRAPAVDPGGSRTTRRPRPGPKLAKASASADVPERSIGHQDLQNPKSEYRNPKQIRSTKSETTKSRTPTWRFVCVSYFGFVSNFDIRISDLVRQAARLGQPRRHCLSAVSVFSNSGGNGASTAITSFVCGWMKPQPVRVQRLPRHQHLVLVRGRVARPGRTAASCRGRCRSCRPAPGSRRSPGGRGSGASARCAAAAARSVKPRKRSITS